MTFASASPGGWGPNDIKQAGLRAAARRSTARLSESGIWRFWPLPHAGYENPEADTHVDFLDDVLSDAGSTPAASTNLRAGSGEGCPPQPLAKVGRVNESLATVGKPVRENRVEGQERRRSLADFLSSSSYFPISNSTSLMIQAGYTLCGVLGSALRLHPALRR